MPTQGQYVLFKSQMNANDFAALSCGATELRRHGRYGNGKEGTND
jgi:hypothetical protein